MRPSQKFSADLVTFTEKILINDAHREKAPPNKTPPLTKSTNMGIWVVGTSNQLVVRGS